MTDFVFIAECEKQSFGTFNVNIFVTLFAIYDNNFLSLSISLFSWRFFLNADILSSLLGLFIHVISPYFGGSSLFFAHFGENLPIWNFRISLYILYISLSGISDLPTKTLAFPSLFNHFSYFETKISLFDFRDVSHVWVYFHNVFCFGTFSGIFSWRFLLYMITTISCHFQYAYFRDAFLY